MAALFGPRFSRGLISILLFALVPLASCQSGSEDAAEAGGSALAPPAAGEGVQVRFGPMEMGPNEEIEDCLVVRLGTTEDLYVRKFVGQMRQGSHHFILWEADGTWPDGKYFKCFAGFPLEGGTSEDWGRRRRMLAGLQSPGNLDTPEFPDHTVAMKIPAGAQLILNSHYINTSSKPIQREVWMNFLTKPKEEVRTLADMVFMVNPIIAVQARSPGRAEIKCPVRAGTQIAMLTGHMHKTGTAFRVYKYDATGTESLIYETTDWSNPDVTYYTPQLSFAIGEGLRYECDYFNPNDRLIRMGMTGDDEMCNLFGIYYPSWGGNLTCNGLF